MTVPLLERWRAKVPVLPADVCWPWQGFVDKAGYGRIRLGGRTEPVGYAHRVAFELLVGPIPEGTELDHVKDRGCTTRACVNPAHLEAVTHGENVVRGDGTYRDRCQRDHPWPEHAYVRPDGGRHCRECVRLRRAGML